MKKILVTGGLEYIGTRRSGDIEQIYYNSSFVKEELSWLYSSSWKIVQTKY